MDKPPRADYTKLASTYEMARPELGVEDPWVEAVIEYGQLFPGQLLLEVGAGTGRWCRRLSRLGRAIALEPCVDMIREGMKRQTDEPIGWVRGEAQAPPFRSGVFDRVLFILSIHHVDNVRQAMAETFRILKPGGITLIRTCGHDYIRGYVLGDFFPGYREVELASFPEVGGLMEGMKSIGFLEVSTRTVREEVTQPVDRYLKRVESKFISTLQRIGEQNFREGFERLSRALEGRREFRYLIEHEIVTGVRPLLPLPSPLVP